VKNSWDHFWQWTLTPLVSPLLLACGLLGWGASQSSSLRGQQHPQPAIPGGQAALMRVPLSGAAYVPPDQPQQQSGNLEARLQAIEAKLGKILKLLEEAAGPGPEERAQAAAPSQALISGLGTCVSCHADRVAKQKGEDFVLFVTRKDEDGKEQSLFRDDFTARELRSIRRAVEDGFMPKKSSGKVLTPDQKTAILNETQALLARLGGEEK
jgi:cytochrome c553